MGEPQGTFWGSMGRKLSVLGGVVGEKAAVAAAAVKRNSIIAGKSAGETASQVASAAAENIKYGWNYMGEGVAHVVDDVNKATFAVPQEVRCDKCSATVVVPSTTFHWVCMDGHVNSMSDLKCRECPASKPIEAKPTIICNSCQTSIVVPTSKIANGLRSTGLATSKLLDTTTSGARKQFQVLSSRPGSFQCPHCLGNIPCPPWVCGTCQQSNTANAVTCVQCSGPQTLSKPSQKFNAEGWPVDGGDKEVVTCPTCEKQSPIPTSAFVATLSATSTGLGAGLKKMYYSLTDEPFVVCEFCHCISALKDILPGQSTMHSEEKGANVIGVCGVCQHNLDRSMIRQKVDRVAAQPAQPAQPAQQQQQQQPQPPISPSSSAQPSCSSSSSSSSTPLYFTSPETSAQETST